MKTTSRTLEFFRTSLSLALAVMMTAHCSTQAGNPGEDEHPPKDVHTIVLPDARGIDLSKLGAGSALRARLTGAAALLTDDAAAPDCAATGKLGIFGLPLGAACASAPFATALLYGKTPDHDGDGKLTCADYTAGAPDQGLLPAMLCDPLMIQNDSIKTLRGDNQGRTNAISFTDYSASDDLTARGKWTASGPDEGRYPANIRMWSAVSGQPLVGFLGLGLKSPSVGVESFDLTMFGTPLLGTIAFDAKADASTCATSPSRDTCQYQELRLKLPEDRATPDTTLTAMHLAVFADQRLDPSFLGIEGKVRYSDAAAAVVFGKPGLHPNLLQVREIYFRTIQKGGQLWGSFVMRDAQGQSVKLPDATGADVAPTFRDGICENPGSDAIQPCTAIVPADYASLWHDETQFETVAPDFTLPLSFDDVPQQVGLGF